VEVSHASNPVNGNRLCLDFVNLPFTSGDPVAHATSWLELVDFFDGQTYRFTSKKRGTNKSYGKRPESRWKSCWLRPNG